MRHLVRGLIAAACLFGPPALGAAGGVAPALLVTIGDVTATTAVVWARLGAEGEVAVNLRSAAGDGATGVLTRTRGGDFTGKRVLTGLKPATRYAWRRGEPDRR